MLFGFLWLWDYERGKDGEMKGLWIFQVIWVLSVVVLLEGKVLWVIQVIWGCQGCWAMKGMGGERGHGLSRLFGLSGLCGHDRGRDGEVRVGYGHSRLFGWPGLLLSIIIYYLKSLIGTYLALRVFSRNITYPK